MAWRSTSTWTSRLSPSSIPAATPASPSRRRARSALPTPRVAWAKSSRRGSSIISSMREAGVKEKGKSKTIRIVPRARVLPKPPWIRVRAPSPNSRFYEIKQILREQKLHTVCEEASCPNIAECFGKGTATFMILGDICTRRCPFCDVAHGRPLAPDVEEPRHLGETIAKLGLSYVVITSVDRDDLKDGGAQHFVDCIRAVREMSPGTTIETLIPDFR